MRVTLLFSAVAFLALSASADGKAGPLPARPDITPLEAWAEMPGQAEATTEGGAPERRALQQGARSRTASPTVVAQVVQATHWDGLGLQNMPLPGREEIVRTALSMGKSPALVVKELTEGDYAPDVD